MRELSLHVLDVVQNSLAADATEIGITIAECLRDNQLRIEVVDNGWGIEPERLDQVLDPFYTSRHSRKVGLGLPLLQAATAQSGGDFRIASRSGEGTTITATFQYDHLDRAPLGSMPDTLVTLIICNPAIRFRYRHFRDERGFQFNSWEIKDLWDGEAAFTPQMADWLKKYLQHGIESLSTF